MYYSGSRKTATLQYNFKTHNHLLKEDIWILETLNNEQKGGDWERVFIGHALGMLKDYFVYRFKLDRSTLEDEIPWKVEWLFPIFHNKGEKATNIFKRTFQEAGILVNIPTHIFRHTFAQDCLEATDWNYELTASIG